MGKGLKTKILIVLEKELNKLNKIHKSFKRDSSVIIQGSYIDTNVEIGSNTKVTKSTLKTNTRIGSDNIIMEAELSGEFSSKEGCKLYGCIVGGKVSLGKYTSLWGPNLHIITGAQQVTIGSFCSIARNVYIQTFNHNHKKLSTYFIGRNIFKEKWTDERVSNGDIRIENDVWIGANVTILGGIVIGNGTVVAANSVVTKDIPPFAIVAGVPAKVIKYRFDESTIEKIQNMAWWDWSIEKINRNKSLFMNEFSEDGLDLVKVNE